MKILLSIVIAVALLLNALRLWSGPRWRCLFSFPLWIYLAWTQWFGGDFQLVLGLALVALLAVGRWLNHFFRGSDDREYDEVDPDDEEDENEAEEEDDDELKFSLHVDPPDPEWRSRFPDEQVVRQRLDRMQRAQRLRLLRGDREPLYLHPDAESEPEGEGETVSALLANIEEYARGERDLDSVTESLDHLGVCAKDRQHDALMRIIESTPDTEKEQLMTAMMNRVIWSRHVPPAEPPGELADWVRMRMAHPELKERQAAAEWLIRHELFDWEEDLGHLEDATLEFLATQIYWNVPVEHRPAVFRLCRKQYETAGVAPDSKELRKPLWSIAARLKLTDYRGDRADAFSREASEFLTREMRRLAPDAYEDYDMRGLWEAYARGAQGPETVDFLREMTACDDVNANVLDESWTALARQGVEGATEAYLGRFDGWGIPHGADFAMEHEPLLRERIRDHLLERLSGDEPITLKSGFGQLRFLLWHHDKKVVDFCAENADRLPADLLSDAAWKFFRQDPNDVLKVMQERGLLDPSPFREVENSRSLKDLLFYQSGPGSLPNCSLSSDSDEYPPRYDDALRDMAAISRGGFPVERARQRILPDPEESHSCRRIEVSWYLGDRRCRFVVEYVGDSMKVRWLLEAANRALEETGRPGRFFGIGDYCYCFQVVFGDPDGWIAASREFSIRLYTEPEMDAIGEDPYRESLLNRFRKS